MSPGASHFYLIALGSNVRTAADGLPRKVLLAAIKELEKVGLKFPALAPIIVTAPLGPSRRRFANTAAVIETERSPEELLALLKGVEQAFGKRSGQRWGARVLDLDIVLWDGGIWAGRHLSIPHPQFRSRDFVLGPAKAIAADWRDPISNLSVAQLHTRLTKPRPAPR